MDTFEIVVKAVATVPDWVPLIVYPAVLVVFTVFILTLGGRRAYPYAAVALGAAAFALMCAKGSLTNAFVFLGMYAALAAVLKLFFFLPPLRRKREKLNKDERIYRKFRESLAEEPDGALPPKVVRYDEERVSAAESGLRLQHAEELLTRLKRAPLAASDRLETDVISRSLDAYREKPLTEEELRTLNDCLASILKLTAKYKL